MYSQRYRREKPAKIDVYGCQESKEIQERGHVSWFQISQKCHCFTCLSESLQSLLFVLYTPTESNAELSQGRYQSINICFLSQALNSIP